MNSTRVLTIMAQLLCPEDSTDCAQFPEENQFVRIGKPLFWYVSAMSLGLCLAQLT